MNEQDIEKLHLCIVNVKELILLAKHDDNHSRVRLLQQILDRLIEKRESLINGREEDTGSTYTLL